MKKLKILIYAAVAVFALSSCSGDDSDSDAGNIVVNVNKNVVTSAMPAAITRLEFPKVAGGSNLVIVHRATLNSQTGEVGINYSLEWDCSKKSQRWSCYEMYQSVTETHTSRYSSDANQYPQDESIPEAYRFASDPFWGTGYNHGHICPSADRLGAFEANYQTFYLSNMQPQLSGFNAGVWEKMENQVRLWDRNDFRDTLYVCKGGTIDNASQILTTTAKGLIVPKYFFMAILCKNSLGYKALGFWVEHKANSDAVVANYVVSIDELERLTGIDFFCNLPDNVENSVESLPVDNIKRAWGLAD
jgi:endonuclease G